MLDTIIYIPTILAYAFISLLVVILCFIVIYVSHKIYISVYDNLPVPTAQSLETISKASSLEKNDEVFMDRTSANSILTQHASRKSKTALRIVVTFQTCYLAYVVFEATPKKALAKTKPASAKIKKIPKEQNYCEHCGNVKEDIRINIASEIFNDFTKTNSSTINNDNENNNNNNANENENNNDTSNTNTNVDENCINSTGSGITVATFGSSVTSLGPHKFVKYFDSLAKIPHGRIMKACPSVGKSLNLLPSEILPPDMNLLSNAYDTIANRNNQII